MQEIKTHNQDKQHEQNEHRNRSQNSQDNTYALVWVRATHSSEPGGLDFAVPAPWIKFHHHHGLVPNYPSIG